MNAQKRTYIKEAKNHIGEEISLSGWVDIRRDHGKLIFIDLRDMSGKVQMVVLPNHAEAHTVATKLRSEWVIKVTGKVNKRPDRMIKKDDPNGEIEIEVLSIEVFNEAETPVFDLHTSGHEVNEETRL